MKETSKDCFEIKPCLKCCCSSNRLRSSCSMSFDEGRECSSWGKTWAVDTNQNYECPRRSSTICQASKWQKENTYQTNQRIWNCKDQIPRCQCPIAAEAPKLRRSQSNIVTEYDTCGDRWIRDGRIVDVFRHRSNSVA
jgi:hypothetical protein